MFSVWDWSLRIGARLQIESKSLHWLVALLVVFVTR